MTFIFILALLILAILAPFIALYAVSLAKKKEYKKHIKIQKTLFWICVTAVLIFEVQLRMSGGSGSLVIHSKYVDTAFFRYLMTAHIVGAVLTYIIWAISIFWSNHKFKKKRTLPGISSRTHRKFAYASIIGLFYTAITAFMVCTFTFFL